MVNSPNHNQSSCIDFGIEIPDCAECLGCCGNGEGEKMDSIPLDFPFLDAVNHNKISSDLVKKLRIFKIPEKLLDEAAKYWRMYPLDNLLRHATLPQADGSYELLTIPEGGCPFLGSKGCEIREWKPYLCAVFPFYIYKLQTHFNYCCPYTDRLEDDSHIRDLTGKYIAQYLIDADKRKKEYKELLAELKSKNKWPTIIWDQIYSSCK